MNSIIDNGILAQSGIWNGLQSYYRMQTGTTVVDYGPNAYNGTSSNVTWVAGKNGNGGSYNTTTSKVELSSSAYYDYERTDSFSIALWLKRLHTGGAAPFIYSKSLASGSYAGHSAYINSSNILEFDLVGTSSTNSIINKFNKVFSATTVWYHIVMTYNGSSSESGALCYADGIEGHNNHRNTLTTSIKNSAKLQIGNRNTALAADAIIDEAGIWNRVLSADEVKALYNAGAGIFY